MMMNDENDVNYNDVNYNAILILQNMHMFCLYKTCTRFALLNHARVLFKFKILFPPNDKAEPPPMLAWNYYDYVSASYFTLDSTCLCLGV